MTCSTLRAIGVLSGKIGSSLLRPDGACRFAHAAAVLGVIDMRPLAFRPQRFARSLAHCLLDFGSGFAQAKRLAVGAVAQSKAFGLVTVCVYQGEGPHADGHGFERGHRLVRRCFAAERRDDVAFAGQRQQHPQAMR